MTTPYRKAEIMPERKKTIEELFQEKNGFQRISAFSIFPFVFLLCFAIMNAVSHNKGSRFLCDITDVLCWISVITLCLPWLAIGFYLLVKLMKKAAAVVSGRDQFDLP